MRNFYFTRSIYGIFFFIISLNYATSQVRINEVMASNSSTISDEDGDFEDWIELFNAGSSTVNLSGYGLSDNYDQPFKWVLPNVSIGPGQFLLVWASGKNRTNPGNPLHTNYGISADGEEVILTNPGNERIDEMEPVPIPTDVSYGRQPDGTGAWYFFEEPTPGSSNNTGGGALLGPPEFSHDGGFYSNPIGVTISHEDPGVTILYTLDGSIPEQSAIGGASYQYKNQYIQNPGQQTGPLLTGVFETKLYENTLIIKDRSGEEDKITGISSTFNQEVWYAPANPVFKGSVVRARAFKEDHLPSEVITRTYFITPESGARYSMPVISLGIQEDYLFDYEKGIYVAGKDFDDWRAGNPGPSANGGHPANYRRRGVEWEYPAHIEIFDPQAGTVIDQDVGVRIHGGWSRARPSKSLRFYARNQYGKSHFEHALFPEAPYPEYKRFFLRNSGNDWGYTLFRDIVIQRTAEPLRVDLQDSRPVILFINAEYWGILNMRERYDKHYLARVYGLDEENVDILSAWGEVDEGDAIHYNAMIGYIETNGVEEEEHYQYINTQIDIDNFIDYQIIQIFARNTDWPGNNIKFWRNKTGSFNPEAPPGQDGRWRWLVYDTDFGFGLFNTSFTDNTLVFATEPNGTSWPNPAWSTFLLRKLLENDSFKISFISRFNDLLNTAFQSERITDIIDTHREMYAPEISEHITRWKSPSSMGNWNSQINLMTTFVQNRPQFQRQHIRQYFELGADINLTIDVSDPAHGFVTVNSIEIKASTPGIGNEPYPYTRSYFNGVPVRIEAVPAPGYAFAGWVGIQDGEDRVLELSPTENLNLTAVFEEVTEISLVHYWNFNDAEEFLEPTVSAGGGSLEIELGAETEVVSSTGGNFNGENARLNDPAGTHLRVNNPLGAEVNFTLPTTGFSGIVLKYESRRSGQGAGIQHLEYTIDGEDYVVFESYEVMNDEPILYTFDFSEIEEADDNPDFSIRIWFEQGSGGTSGNNRFDNLTLEGYPLEGLNQPPILVNEISIKGLIENGAPYIIDLEEVFNDPEGDAIMFDVSNAYQDNVQTTLEGHTLTFSPLSRGDAEITIIANDGANESLPYSFRILVYPEAKVLEGSDFQFTEWSADQPERTYPEHMLFLQSDIDDPDINYPLDFPYYITHDDYHGNDSDVIGFPYNATGRTRLNGLGEEGIGLINTGRGRDLGGVLLAVNTIGVSDFQIKWLCGTLLENSRVYGFNLQYRVGMEGPFKNLQDGAELNYRANKDGHTRLYEDVEFPADMLEQPYVQLLWKYHHLNGSSGPRAQLRLDNIMIGGPVGETQFIGPADVSDSGDITLAWLSAQDATHYHLQLAAEEDFLDIRSDQRMVNGENMSVSGLPMNINLFARVRGAKATSNGPWSDPLFIQATIGSVNNVDVHRSYFYPNPAGSQAHLQFSLTKSSYLEVIIYDYTGRVQEVLIRNSYGGGNHEVLINTGGLKPGGYLLKIQSDHGMTMHKFIKN